MMSWRQLVGKSNGMIVPKGKYNAMLPYWLGIDPKDVPTLPVAITTNGKPVGMRAPLIAYEGGFEGKLLTFEDSTDGTGAANWTVDMMDIVGRRMMNAPCHVRTVFGTAQLPAVIEEPLTLFYREKMEVTLRKITGGSVNGRINCGGAAYCPNNIQQQAFIAERIKGWSVRRQNVYPFWYTPISAPLGGALVLNGTTTSFDIKIGDHFEAFKMAFVSTGEFGFQLTEIRSGQVLSNGFVSSAAGLGDATFPWIFDRPYLIPQGSRLRFTFQDLSGGDNTIFVTIQGRKIIGVPLQNVPEVLADTDMSFDDQRVSADFFQTMTDELVSR